MTNRNISRKARAKLTMRRRLGLHRDFLRSRKAELTKQLAGWDCSSLAALVHALGAGETVKEQQILKAEHALKLALRAVRKLRELWALPLPDEQLHGLAGLQRNWRLPGVGTGLLPAQGQTQKVGSHRSPA